MNTTTHITPYIEGVYPLSKEVADPIYDQLILAGAPKHGRHAFHLCYDGLCSEFAFTGQYGRTIFRSKASGFSVFIEDGKNNDSLDKIRPALAQLHKQHMQEHTA